MSAVVLTRRALSTGGSGADSGTSGTWTLHIPEGTAGIVVFCTRQSQTTGNGALGVTLQIETEDLVLHEQDLTETIGPKMSLWAKDNPPTGREVKIDWERSDSGYGQITAVVFCLTNVGSVEDAREVDVVETVLSTPNTVTLNGGSADGLVLVAGAQRKVNSSDFGGFSMTNATETISFGVGWNGGESHYGIAGELIDTIGAAEAVELTLGVSSTDWSTAMGIFIPSAAIITETGAGISGNLGKVSDIFDGGRKRIIFCGDSYSVTDSTARQNVSIRNAIEVKDWVSDSIPFRGGGALFFGTAPSTTGITRNSVTETGNWLCNDGTYFGLPTYWLESITVAAAASAGQNILRFSEGSSLVGHATGFLFEDGDEIEARIIYRRPFGTPVPSVSINGNSVSLLHGDQGQVAATKWVNLGIRDGSMTIDITLDEEPTETKYFDFFQIQLRKKGEYGTHWSTIGSQSFSFADYGDGEAFSATKRTSVSQMTRWVEATEIEPKDPCYVVHFFGYEDLPDTAAYIRDIDALCSAWDSACLKVRGQKPHHFFIIPWKLWGGTVQNMTDGRDACHIMSQLRDNFSYFSISEATGNEDWGGDATMDTWLSTNGYTTIDYGGGSVTLNGVAMTDQSAGNHPLLEKNAVFFNLIVQDFGLKPNISY